MTSARVWLEGARPRTLGASVAPVLVGTAAAAAEPGDVSWWRAAGALVVAVALQVGVNYANDYSDGVRGTDTERRGPVRLTATGLASPRAVRTAAGIAFAVAGVAGAVLALAVQPWLLLLGAAAIGAAALYTGGPHPYGYLGLGEAMVLLFFGFAATAGSAYVQLERVPATAWWGSLVAGLPACAILLANNLRDRETDTVAGKRTLAVRLGESTGRTLYGACLLGALLAIVPMGVLEPWALLGLLAAPLAWTPWRLVATRNDARSLVVALVATSRFDVVLAALVAAGLWLA